MAPGAEATLATSNGHGYTNGKSNKGPTEASIDPDEIVTNASSSTLPFPKPPKFTDQNVERAYLKFRLAQAFRIFGKCLSPGVLALCVVLNLHLSCSLIARKSGI